MESLPYSKELLTASGVFLLPDNSLILGEYHELVAREFSAKLMLVMLQLFHSLQFHLFISH